MTTTTNNKTFLSSNNSQKASDMLERESKLKIAEMRLQLAHIQIDKKDSIIQNMQKETTIKQKKTDAGS